MFLVAGSALLPAFMLAVGLPTFLHLVGPPVAASSGALSEHALDEISGMPPQDQATRVLERTPAPVRNPLGNRLNPPAARP